MSPVLEFRKRDGYWNPLRGGAAFPVGGVAEPSPVDPNYVLPDGTPLGPADMGTLDVYTGTGAGDLLTISATDQVYYGVDFGSTRVKIEGARTKLRHCRWNMDRGGNTRDSLLIDTMAAAVGVELENLDINASYQGNPGMSAIGGRNYTLRNSRLRNFTDFISAFMQTSAGGDLGVLLEGNWLSDMTFWAHPNTGVVHPSDDITHCDLLQGQGGKGIDVIRNRLDAHYSTTLGTGTPGSGDEFVPGTGYTNAWGVSKRYEIVEGNGQFSAGQPGAFLGGSIAALMFSNGGRGDMGDNNILDNWGSGGAQWLNAGGYVGTAPFLTVHRNKIKRDQRQSNGQLSVKATVSVDDGRDTANRNVDWDTNQQIVRVNG